jgi:hypothetical protein
MGEATMHKEEVEAKHANEHCSGGRGRTTMMWDEDGPNEGGCV